MEVDPLSRKQLTSTRNNFLALSPELQDLMSKMCRSTLDNYNTIDIQQRMPNQTGPCWIQEPATLTDALGRVSPIHLVFINSWEVFDSVLAARFLNLPGQKNLRRGEYALQSQDATRDLKRNQPFETFLYS